MNELEILNRWQAAPNGSNVICWGKGFVSTGIRTFQEYESLETEKKLKEKRNIDYDITAPTHVETKVDQTNDISAEMKGVEKVPFERLLEKNIGLVLAEPMITTNEEREWQFRVIQHLQKYVDADAPYDWYGFFSFIYRAADYFLPLPDFVKMDFDFAGFCSEIAAEAYYLEGGQHFLRLEEDPGMISPLEFFYKINQSPFMKVTVLKDPDNIIKIVGTSENNGMAKVIAA